MTYEPLITSNKLTLDELKVKDKILKEQITNTICVENSNEKGFMSNIFNNIKKELFQPVILTQSMWEKTLGPNLPEN
jgi:hypothetical protein